MAACLRSVHMGDPFSQDEGALPPMPEQLVQEVDVVNETFAGIRCTIYSPQNSTEKLPVMLYMHGGGFVVGCSEDTDYVTRMLCHSNQVVVVSVNYRLAPETIFPGALTDCENVLTAALSQSSNIGVNPELIYLAGDSAGANLAMALCCKLQHLRTAFKGLILLAPWLDMENEKYESFNRLGPTGIVFDAASLAYSRAAYVGFAQWKDPLVSPLYGSLAQLPRTIVLIGTEDPLLDQSLELKRRALESSCSQIEVVTYPGMPHCFYSFPNLFDEEQDCYKRISSFVASTTGAVTGSDTL